MSGDEQRVELDRVFERIAPLIDEFRLAQANSTFHVEDLRRFVLDRLPGIAPDSPGRILRAMRLEGLLNYVVINRRASLYQFRPVPPRPRLVVDEEGQCRFEWG